ALSGGTGGRPAGKGSLVKMPDFTLNAVAVKGEIPLHPPDKDSHALYVVSGRGVATIEGKPGALKPRNIVPTPPGTDHRTQAEGGELGLVDFVRHGGESTGTDKK